MDVAVDIITTQLRETTFCSNDPISIASKAADVLRPRDCGSRVRPCRLRSLRRCRRATENR